MGALDRIGAQCAANVLREALKLFGEGLYPTDRTQRNKTLDSLPTDVFSNLTDRLFDESEDVRSLAIDRVRDAYIKNEIRDESRASSKLVRWFAMILLFLFIIAVIGAVIASMQGEKQNVGPKTPSVRFDCRDRIGGCSVSRVVP